MEVITVPVIGAVVTGVEATGEVAITDTIITIIIILITMLHVDVRRRAAIQQEEILPAVIAPLLPDVQFPTGLRAVHLL